jgi:hypothetical protein
MEWLQFPDVNESGRMGAPMSVLVGPSFYGYAVMPGFSIAQVGLSLRRVEETLVCLFMSIPPPFQEKARAVSLES